MFEDQLRACRTALDKIGAASLPIIVGETGWPSAGGKGNVTFRRCKRCEIDGLILTLLVAEVTSTKSLCFSDTNIANMQTYTNYIVNFARSNPLASTIYIFEAYDESWKTGDLVEKNWGLYYENRNPKFGFDIASYGELKSSRFGLVLENRGQYF